MRSRKVVHYGVRTEPLVGMMDYPLSGAKAAGRSLETMRRRNDGKCVGIEVVGPMKPGIGRQT